MSDTPVNAPRAVTVQINSFPALQRLLGDDPEMHLALRNSVVDKMTPILAKRLSSDLLGTQALRRVVESAVKAVSDEQVTAVEEVIGNVKKGSYPVVTLHATVKQAIKSHVEGVIHQKVQDIVQSTVASLNIEKMVMACVKQVLTTELQEKARTVAMDAVKAAFSQ